MSTEESTESPLATAKRREQRSCRLIAMLCLLAYLPSIIGLCFGAVPFAEDTLSLFGPWREWSKQVLWDGQLPLWNPHIFAGLPFMGNGQASVLYAPNVIYWVLPTSLAFVIDALLHNILLALGGYALARSLGQSRTAAFVAAVALGLSGAVSSHINTGHFTWHAARAYIPWELWSLLLYLRSGQRRYAFGFALLVSLQVASGYPPMTLLGAGMSCGLFIAYVVSNFWANRVKSQQSPSQRETSPQGASRGPSGLPRGWISAAVATTALIIALSAIFVLPLREASRMSVHGSGLEYEVAAGGSGTWRSVLRLLIPGFFGGNRPGQWSMKFGAWEEAAYGGMLVFVLATGALFFVRRTTRSSDSAAPDLEESASTEESTKPFAQVALSAAVRPPAAVPWLWALLPLSLIVALGSHTPVHRWLFDHVLLFRLTRVPLRWLEVWAFCAAFLAGFSFDAVLHRAQNPYKARVVQRVLAVIVAAISGLVLFLVFTPASRWMQTARAIENKPLAPLELLEITSGWRTTAILESLIALVLAALGAVFLARWLRSKGRERRRAEISILAVMALDVLLVFWKEDRVVTFREASSPVVWPQKLTQIYEPSQRWITHIGFDAFNHNIAKDMDTFDGYDALGSKRYYAYISALEGGEVWAPMYQPLTIHPLLRVAGVTHLLSFSEAPPRTFEGEAVLRPAAKEGEWQLWRYDGGWPRFYLSRRVLRTEESQQLPLLEKLSRAPFDAANPAAVVGPASFAQPRGMAICETPLSSDDKVLRWTRTPNQMDIWANAAHSSVLVQAEALYPGWRAWVNGESVPLESANYLFRGVAIPQGKSHTALVYDSQTFRFGCFLSLLGLTWAAALGAAARATKPRPMSTTK